MATVSKQNKFTVSELRKALRLDASTGKLYWLARDLTGDRSRDRAVKIFNTRFAGTEALTSQNEKGARQGSVNGKTCKAGPVVWALSFGQWPSVDVAHRNGDPADNRPSNLFLATRGKGPRAIRSDSLSGVKGVSRHGLKWRSRLRINGNLLHLGNFDTREEAEKAVLQALQSRAVPDPRGARSSALSGGRHADKIPSAKRVKPAAQRRA